KDREWLVSPLHLNFWRPTTNNDEGAKLNDKLKVWQYAGVKAKASQVTAAQDGKDVTITATLQIPAGDSSATIQYRITGNGQILVDTEFRAGNDLPTIPRIGFQAQIPNNSPLLQWHGKGPQENYIDRSTGAWTTIHGGLIPALFHRYADPQESGNRTGIRWVTLSAPAGGASLRVDATGEHLLEMSVYPCSAADITLAVHPDEIPQRDFQTLNLDHRHSGLGGSDSWGALALPKYLIKPNSTYRWSFMLTASEAPAAQTPILPRPR
ncbi:MAG: beta-galactosidase small subunit, partial [Akkermansiaceae bacterium]